MADIRINALATTAASTASDDFVAVDGSANGTRKLNAFSPTFGGNLTVSGGIAVGGSGIQSGFIADVKGNAVVRGGLYTVGGAASIDGNIGATGNLTVSGGTSTFGTANGGTYITTPGTAASTGSLFIQGGNASGSTAGGGVVLYGGSHASAPGWVRVGLAGTSKFAVNTSGLGAGTDVFTVDQAGNLTVSGTISSGTATLTLNSTSNTVVLQSAGTTALTLDSSQNATFAGTGQQSFNGIIQVAKTAAGANSNLLDLYNKGTTNNTSSGIAFSANNASSAQRTSAEIRGIMTVTTAGSEESELWFSTRGAGVASGTAALKIANTGDATFAGRVVFAVGKWQKSSESKERLYFEDNSITYVKGGKSDNTGNAIVLRNIADDDVLTISNTSAKTATFAGAIAIGNTVNTVSPTSPNRTITMVIGGTTYYIHAKTTND